MIFSLRWNAAHAAAAHAAAWHHYPRQTVFLPRGSTTWGVMLPVVNGNATIVIIRLSWMGALCRIRVLHAEERNHSYTHMSGGFLRSVMVKCHCQSAKGIG